MDAYPFITLTLNPAIDTSGEVGRLEPSHKLRCHDVRRDPGGGGVNVARVLGRLGAQALAVFPVGGAIGGLLENLASAEGLPHVAVRVVGETRENLTVRDASTGSEYRFVFPGPKLSATALDAICAAAVSRLTASSWLLISGSLPEGAPPDLYRQLALAAKKKGARIAIDAAGTPLRLALAASPDLVKVSAHELSELTDMALYNNQDCVSAARTLIAQGARLVAVSWGARGGVLVSGSHALAAAAPCIDPLSTIGAGDSFFAALAWALAGGCMPTSALECAVAAGSAALLSPGTTLCSAFDVERLHANVHALPIPDIDWAPSEVPNQNFAATGAAS